MLQIAQTVKMVKNVSDSQNVTNSKMIQTAQNAINCNYLPKI